MNVSYLVGQSGIQIVPAPLGPTIGIQSGGIVSGLIGAGQIGVFHLQSGLQTSGLVLSGGLGSGQVAAVHVQSGTLIAGAGINITFGLSGITVVNASGSSVALASGNVTSGYLGTIANSIAVISGKIGSGAIQGSLGGGYFNIASGTIGTNDIGSGAVITAANYFILGSFNTMELISGIRGAAINPSGYVQIAMASVSGRNPCFGLVTSNVASGSAATIYTAGQFQFNMTAASSGLVDYSGYVGQVAYLGRSGQVVSVSGSYNSGGFGPNDIIQELGIIVNSGSIVMN